MTFRKPLATTFAVGILGLATAASIRASVVDHTTYLTFNRPVSLPGVALGSGTYIFEIADSAGSHDVVRVLSRDRKLVYFLGLTHAVRRPAGLRADQVISFAEAPPSRP